MTVFAIRCQSDSLQEQGGEGLAWFSLSLEQLETAVPAF